MRPCVRTLCTWIGMGLVVVMSGCGNGEDSAPNRGPASPGTAGDGAAQATTTSDDTTSLLVAFGMSEGDTALMKTKTKPDCNSLGDRNRTADSLVTSSGKVIQITQGPYKDALVVFPGAVEQDTRIKITELGPSVRGVKLESNRPLTEAFRAVLVLGAKKCTADNLAIYSVADANSDDNPQYDVMQPGFWNKDDKVIFALMRKFSAYAVAIP